MNTKILIIDDDIDVINIYETVLKREGYKIFSAINKEAGVKTAREQKPGLIILDVMMTTQYEGFEMKKDLDADIDLKNVPVIIQTSIDVLTTTDRQKESIQDMAREFRKDPSFKDLQVLLIKNMANGLMGVDYMNEAGKNVYFEVDGFLKKPVNAGKLLAEVERLLKKL